MIQVINTLTESVNSVGQGFWSYAAGIFVQASMLIVLLLIIDLALQKRVRAVFRYCLWMLLFVKLVLPASFTLPTGVGYWLGDYFRGRVSTVESVSLTEVVAPAVFEMQRVDVAVEPAMGAMRREAVTAGVGLEPVSWEGLVFLGWAFVMGVLLASLVQRALLVRKLIAQSIPASGRLAEMVDECRRVVGIGKDIELRLSVKTHSPAVCGLLRPIIVVPAALLDKMSDEELRVVLTHELAHIKRADIWVNVLQAVLQIVYFYNPLVWIANAMVRRAREQAVDEMVLVTLKPETRSYSNTLIDIAEMASWRPNADLRLVSVVESKKALERRIKHMLNRPAPKSSKLGFLGLLAIIAIGAVAVPMGCRPLGRSNAEKAIEISSEDNTIVAGERVGDYVFGMSKDEILERLGEPRAIFYGDEKYTLDDLPQRYFMVYSDISFGMKDDSVEGLTALSPFYKFANGLGVGSSEREIKKAFGDDFHVREFTVKDFLGYEHKGVMFEIKKSDRTVMEVNIFPAEKKADIPSTSRINEEGRIVDKTDYPFVDDPKVIGGWKSVDFVQEIGDFNPKKRNWEGDLYLNHFVFEEGGKLARIGLTWTQGLVLSDGTASKYTIKEMDGSTYMFYEWKSGDYTIRHMRPSYYVLKKVPVESLKFEAMFGKKADIPPTSTFNEEGHIVDKVDWPFVNDPKVIGTWKSVDFVDEMAEFKVGEQQWGGRGGKLFLHEMIFGKNGRLISKNDNAARGYPGTWTKGLVIYDNDTKTASKYTIKEMGGSSYMFYEWKSGDYTFRYRKPSYYVLKKASSETVEMPRMQVSPPNDPEFARELPARIEQLDIDTADLEEVKEIFGKPAQYIWGQETFTEDDLPRQYILVYPGRFNIYMRENEIVELRHERGSEYVFRDTLQCGSTLEEVFEVIGRPERTVEGEGNSFEDGVLYKDIDGRKGHCYYARHDQDVRLWFLDYKIIAIYMTRSDYGTWSPPRKGLVGLELNDDSWPLVNVVPGMPAAEAGLQNGDKILTIDGEDVTGITTIREAIAALAGEPGEKVELTVQRGDEILTFEVERSK